VHAATPEQQALAYIKQIGSIRANADTKTISAYNKTMDAAWKFFNANSGAALPVMRRELKRELGSKHPNDLILLDIGYFIRLQPSHSDKELGKQALFGLDPDSAIVQQNQQELFEFAYAVVSDKDARVLPFLDRVFLAGKITAYVPQHALSLDETLVCVFLYGKYGPAAERHLASQLDNPRLVRKILEILIWLGTPDSVEKVRRAMASHPDYDTFARSMTFMMTAGGPRGRKALLALNPGKFDDKSRKTYAKAREKIAQTNYTMLSKRFSGDSGPQRLSDDELKKRLTAMYSNYGKDENTQPSAIFVSGLPREYLIDELVKIRGRMFYRLSDEALDDVQITNAILNTLYYKPQ